MKQIECDEQVKEKIALLITYIVIAIFNILCMCGHELWRDETQAWLISRDCSLTAGSLFTVTSYEGHPFLWFLVLMPFSKLGFPVWILKVVSYFFVMGGLFFLFWKTRFPILLKILMAFSPMFVCFLVVPARCYSLAAFLMVIWLIAYDKRESRPYFYGITLALLIQTHTIYAGFVLGACVVWGIEIIIYMINGNKNAQIIFKKITAICIPFFSAVFLLWEFRYTKAAITYHAHDLALNFYEAIKEMEYSFQLLFGEWSFFCLFALAVLILYLLVVSKNGWKGFIILAFGLGWQIYVFVFAASNANNRGISWLFIIVAAMNAICDDWKSGSNYSLINIGENNYCTYVFFYIVIILFLSMQYNVSTLRSEISYDSLYSQGKEIAEVINELPKDSAIFITVSDFDSPVSSQVDDSHVVYSPFSKSRASYMDRNPANEETMKFEELKSVIFQMFPEQSEAYIVVGVENTNIIGLQEKIADGDNDIEIYYFNPCETTANENYYILKLYNDGLRM